MGLLSAAVLWVPSLSSASEIVFVTSGSPARATTAVADEQAIDTVVDAMVPASFLEQLIEGGANVTWRRAMNEYPEMRALEQKYPGVTQAMVDGFKERALEIFRKAVQLQRDNARNKLIGLISGAQLIRVAFALKPWADIMNQVKVELLKTDTISTAMDRAIKDPLAVKQQSLTRERLIALDRSDNGLGGKVFSLVSDMRKSNDILVVRIIMDSKPAGYRAANNFVRARGLKDLPFPSAE